MKVKLIKNNRYWDPKTETHLTRTNSEREFTESELEELDLSNIEYAIEVDILETDSEEFNNTEEETAEEAELEAEEGETILTCKATTGSGDQCSNKAVWPEEDPVYCHIESHKKNHTDYESLTATAEEELQEEQAEEPAELEDTDNPEEEDNELF